MTDRMRIKKHVDTLEEQSGPPSTYKVSYPISTIGIDSFTQGSSQGDHKSPTMYSYVKVDRTDLLGTVYESYSVGSGRSLYLKSGFIGVSADTSAMGDFKSIAWNKAVDKLNDLARGNLDLAVDLVQIGQTFDQLRSFTPKRILGRIGNLTGLTKNVVSKTKDFLGKKSIKASSDEWLGYVYGIKPTLQDIHDLCSLTMDESQKPDFIKLKVRSSVSNSRTDRSLSATSYPLSGWVEHTVSRTQTDRYEICLWIGNQSTLSDISKFSSLNPASIIWECLPYSFVVDWFYNVGGYIRNLETAVAFGSSFTGGYSTYSQRIINETIQSDRSVNKTLPNHIYYRYGQGSYVRQAVSRQALTSYPMPRPPVLNLSLGSGRLLNAAALLGALLR